MIDQQLNKLTSQFPDFWSKQLQEETGFQSLLKAYSYAYASIYKKWESIKNELSPFTTEPYTTEYYKVIDLRKTYTPSYIYDQNNLFYELPDNTFKIDGVYKNINSNNSDSITYRIGYDRTKGKSFLEISANSLEPSDRYLYIKTYYIDNSNMINTWGSLFLDISPIIPMGVRMFDDDTSAVTYYNSDVYETQLRNYKAQIINMIRCASTGGSLDSLESLLSVAMNQPFVEQDGVIVDYDGYSTTIKFNDGTISSYPVAPKPRFQNKNEKIYAYECPGQCPAKLYTWVTNPARFTQALLCNNANLLFNLLSLNSDEQPSSLRFDNPYIQFDQNITFDFGVMQKPGNAFNSTPYYQYPWEGTIDAFTDWTSPTLHNRIYEFFKNVIICEIPVITNGGGCDCGGGTATQQELIWEDWLFRVLEYFRALHSKFTILKHRIHSYGCDGYVG